MGRPRKKPVYLIALASDLDCVGEDRVFDPESEPNPCLLNELQCPVADEVLIALRQAFSMTYPRNPLIDGLQAAIGEIRRIGADALKGMPEVLSELKLKPIPPVLDDPTLHKAHVFLYSFVRAADLNISVTVNGRKRRLLTVAHWAAADLLIRTLREVVADTFLESYDEEQYTAILEQIRERIWKVLPDYNVCLESMEIEPIASRPSDDDSEQTEAS